MQILEEDLGLINYIEQPDGVFNGLDQVSIQKEDKKIRGNLHEKKYSNFEQLYKCILNSILSFTQSRNKRIQN